MCGAGHLTGSVVSDGRTLSAWEEEPGAEYLDFSSLSYLLPSSFSRGWPPRLYPQKPEGRNPSITQGSSMNTEPWG